MGIRAVALVWALAMMAALPGCSRRQEADAGSRKAYNAACLAKYFESYRSYSYETPGAPETTEDPVRVGWPASGIKWNSAGQPPRLVSDLFQYRGEHEVAVPLYQFVVREIPKYSNWYAAIFAAGARRFLAESLVATGGSDEAPVQMVAAQIPDPFDMANHALLAALSGGG